MLWCIKTKAKSQHNLNPACGSNSKLACKSIYKIQVMRMCDWHLCLDKLVTQTWIKNMAYAIVHNDKLVFFF